MDLSSRILPTLYARTKGGFWMEIWVGLSGCFSWKDGRDCEIFLIRGIWIEIRGLSVFVLCVVLSVDIYLEEKKKKKISSHAILGPSIHAPSETPTTLWDALLLRRYYRVDTRVKGYISENFNPKNTSSPIPT